MILCFHKKIIFFHVSTVIRPFGRSSITSRCKYPFSWHFHPFVRVVICETFDWFSERNVCIRRIKIIANRDFMKRVSCGFLSRPKKLTSIIIDTTIIFIDMGIEGFFLRNIQQLSQQCTCKLTTKLITWKLTLTGKLKFVMRLIASYRLFQEKGSNHLPCNTLGPIL